jgi:hypothetical protein
MTEAVITGELLEQRLNGNSQRTIRIGPKAVLTPSARDFLKQRNIEWTRLEKNAAPATNSGIWKAIVASSTPALASALDEIGKTAGTRWERELSGDATEAATAAVSALCRGEAVGVAVFAGNAAAVACRANRNAKVRAAVVWSVRCVEAAKRQIGSNLIAVDPAGKSYFELRNLVRAFAADGPPRVPAGWEA